MESGLLHRVPGERVEEAGFPGAQILGIGILRVYNWHEYRHAVERMDPAHYLAASYYERWLTGVATLLVEKGVVTRAELEARAGGQFPLSRPPASVELDYIPPPEIPRFAVGGAVVVRDIHPPGHTRVPRYVRGKRGGVVHVAPRFVFPDTAGHGMHAHREPTYHVEFPARDLWTDAAASGRDRDRRPVGELPGGCVMNDPRHPVAPAPVAERVQALEGALSARQLVPDGFLDAAAAQAERELSPRNGAQVVARAWLDPAYRARLLADGTAAAAELGFNATNSNYLVVLENTPTLHNVIVCTQCSCTAWSVIGFSSSLSGSRCGSSVIRTQ